MEKVIGRSPAIFVTYQLHLVTVLFAGDHYGRCGSLTVIEIAVFLPDCAEKRMMDVQMNWLLVMQEYIIRFRDIFPKVTQRLWITTARRIAKKHPGQRQIVFDPGPESMTVDLIDTYHV